MSMATAVAGVCDVCQGEVVESSLEHTFRCCHSTALSPGQTARCPTIACGRCIALERISPQLLLDAKHRFHCQRHLQEKVTAASQSTPEGGKRIMHGVAKFQRYKLAKDAVRSGMRQKDAAQLYAVNASRLSRVMRLPGRVSGAGGTRKAAPSVERKGENDGPYYHPAKRVKSAEQQDPHRQQPFQQNKQQQRQPLPQAQHFTPWQTHYTVQRFPGGQYATPGPIPNIISYRPSPPPAIDFSSSCGSTISQASTEDGGRRPSWSVATADIRETTPVSPSSPTPSSASSSSDAESVHHLDELAAACASARETDLQAELQQVREELARTQEKLRAAQAQLVVQQGRSGGASSQPPRYTMTPISAATAHKLAGQVTGAPQLLQKPHQRVPIPVASA